jgi:Zn-finger nucleic acid-binding protein
MQALPGMLCPVCRVDLVMSDRQGVEIDYCPKCRGVWLDRGELDKIIDRAAPEGTPPPPPDTRSDHSRDYERHYDDDRRRYDPRYRKRKSILSEIFDF